MAIVVLGMTFVIMPEGIGGGHAAWGGGIVDEGAVARLMAGEEWLAQVGQGDLFGLGLSVWGRPALFADGVVVLHSGHRNVINQVGTRTSAACVCAGGGSSSPVPPIGG